MPTANPLRVGLIGAGGRWGPWAHVPALQGLAEAELYAVCTAHADTAQAAAEKYGVKHAYGDVKALSADPQVEAALRHGGRVAAAGTSGQGSLLRVSGRRR